MNLAVMWQHCHSCWHISLSHNHTITGGWLF